jgi:hypothetical protein
MSKEDEEILRAILEKGSDKAKKAAADALAAQPSLPDEPLPVKQAKQKRKVKGLGKVIGNIGKSKFYQNKEGHIVDQDGQVLEGRLADILSQETEAKKAAVQQAVTPTADYQNQKNAERQIGGALSSVVKATSNLTKTQGKVLTTMPNAFGEIEKVITNITTQHEKVVSTLIKQNDELRDKVVETLTGVKTATKAGGAKMKPSKGVGGSKAAKLGQIKTAATKKAAREEKETRQKKEVAEKPTFAGQMKSTAKSMGMMALAGAAAGALANVSGVGQGPPPGGGPGGGPGGAAPAPGGMWPNTPSSGNNKQVLETIKKRESGGNYNAQAKGSSASGAYQFIDSTWRARAKAAGVDTNQYPRAVSAPPEIQDKVADAYISEILAKNNNDVSKIPLVWYTGNAAGQMSSAALAANRGLTPQAYQASWMKTYQQMGGNATVASANPSAPAGMPTAAPTAPAAPAAPGAPQGGPAGAGGGDIVSLGKELQGQENIRVSENPSFGGVHPVHKGKGHYEGRAIDVNAGTGIVEAEHPIWGPKFDQIASSARQRGFMVIWRSAGHFNHMHIESKNAGSKAPDSDTTTGEPVAIAADSKSPQVQAGQTLAAASQQNAATELLGANQGGMVVMQNDRFVNNTRTIYQTSSYSQRKMEQSFNPYNMIASAATGRRGLF